AWMVYYSNSYCYVANDTCGLQVYQFLLPEIREIKNLEIKKEKSRNKFFYDNLGRKIKNNVKKLPKGLYFLKDKQKKLYLP
ncbi:MAG: hypothetical protein NZ608_07330, partial [candidate division WOR-3 bacterium]|nr:hypothetical protein [candidate division WOR-3 bacterium]